MEMLNAGLRALHRNLHMALNVLCRCPVGIGRLESCHSIKENAALHLNDPDVELEASLVKLSTQELNKQNGNAVAVLLIEMAPWQ